MTVPREVPASVMRKKLDAIDPHRDLPFDIAKIIVIAGLLGGGIVLRLEPMPERVVGGGMIGLSVFLLAVWGRGATRRAERRERRLLAAIGPRPFFLTGYATYLTADVPLLEITLAQPGGLGVAIPDAIVEQVDPRTLRVALPARRLGTLRGGDPDRLRRFLDQLPATLAIERVELGGTVAPDDDAVN